METVTVAGGDAEPKCNASNGIGIDVSDNPTPRALARPSPRSLSRPPTAITVKATADSYEHANAKRVWFFRAALAEFVCTSIFFALLFALIETAHIQRWDATTSLLVVSAMGGVLVAAFIYTFGNISGGYFSTSLTIATLAIGRHSWRTCVLYLFAQLLGSVTAVLIIMGIFPYSTERINVLTIIPPIDDQGRVIGMEAFLTFIAVYAFMNTSYWHPGFGPLCTGFITACLPIAGASVSGGAFNMARMFGPALLSNRWDSQHLYWIGQTIGAVTAGVFSQYVQTKLQRVTYKQVLTHHRKGSEHCPIFECVKSSRRRLTSELGKL